MKKRLRKKLHKGEFQQLGISLFVPSNSDDAEMQLDTILNIADNNNILFIGGGFGRFSMPSEKYGNLDIPKKIVDMIMYIALSNEEQLDGIIGYFVNPFEHKISQEIAEKVNAELKNILNTEFKINLRVDLWN